MGQKLGMEICYGSDKCKRCCRYLWSHKEQDTKGITRGLAGLDVLALGEKLLSLNGCNRFIHSSPLVSD